jgi:hypothetical protein
MRDAEREMVVHLELGSPWCAGASTVGTLASPYELSKWSGFAARDEAKHPVDVAGRTEE